VFRQGMNADKEILAAWMGSFPSIRVHLWLNRWQQSSSRTLSRHQAMF